MVPKECNQEAKKLPNKSQTLLVDNGLVNSFMCVNIEKIIDVERYNSFHKLCHVTAYVFRFVNNLKNSVKRTESLNKNELDVEEIVNAQRTWLKITQHEFYKNEKIKQLVTSRRLYEDEFSLLRSKTRLCEASEIPSEVKFPIVLPNFHHITDMIIWDAHEEVMHSGVHSTLNRVRLKYWILRGRQSVAKVVKRCTLCKLSKLRCIKPTVLSNLPGYRVCSEHPYQKTGLDFAGPLLVKNLHGSDAEMYKGYILLFTCATTRGVHLEFTPDTGALALIRAIQRFLCRKWWVPITFS